MDSENDKKRMDVEVDRLSSLPDDLIHKILSYNDTIDAIETSSLSSRWRYVWTSMPCLELSSEDFSTLPKFSRFVKHVLSDRDNHREVSSVKFTFRGKASQVFVKRILKYAYSHNVQQLTITCLVDSHIEFPLSLFSSKCLKHLTLKKVSSHRRYKRGSITLTSMWELSALTTLHLDGIEMSNDNIGLISKCENLKNLTIKYCERMGSDDFNLCHSQLSDLTIEYVSGSKTFVSVVAPQLKNCSIKGYPRKILISAPDLACLFIQCCDSLNFTGNDVHSLESVDICIDNPYKGEPVAIVGLLQRLHNVKFLTLNMEILEHLSSSLELISHQPSPFASLKRLKIYPNRVDKWELPKEKIDMASEVKNYMLDSSPSATFIMVSREDIITERKALSAKSCMAELRMLLDQEKADIETNMALEQENTPMESRNAKMDEELNTQVENQVHNKDNMAHIVSCWDGLSDQIEQGQKKIVDIIWKLRNIKILLTELPASTRTEMQPCFSSLCAEADIVTSKIRDIMKIQVDKNQSRLSASLHELATTLESSY